VARVPVIKRFERLHLLGSGTRTVTEKARVAVGASTGRVVTLVTLLPHAEASAPVRDGFIARGQALMQLDHPQVPEPLELGRSRTHYLAREHIEGHSLRRLLAAVRRDGRLLPAGFACDVVIQLGATVLSLRRRLAQAQPALASGASFGGTLRSLVISPEGRVRWVDPLGLDDPALPRGPKPGPADEVLALGVLLYELLTTRPAPAPSDGVDFELCAPSTLNEAVPGALDELCRRALGFGPGEAPLRGVGELMDALGEAAAGLPTPAPGWLAGLLRPVEAGTPVSRPRSLSPKASSHPSLVPADPTLRSPAPVLNPEPELEPPAAPEPAERSGAEGLITAEHVPRTLPPIPPTRKHPERPAATSAQAAPRPVSGGGSAGTPILGESVMVRSQRSSGRLRAVAALGLLALGSGLLIERSRRSLLPPSLPKLVQSEQPALPPAPPPPPLPGPKPDLRVEPMVARPLSSGPPATPPPLPLLASHTPSQPPHYVGPRPSARERSASPRTRVSLALAEPAGARSRAPEQPAAPTSAKASPSPAQPAIPAPAAQPAPAAAPPNAAPGPLNLPYSGFVASHRLSGEEPRLPPALLTSLGQASAVARICVDEKGAVKTVRFLRATAGFEEPLRRALATWHYRPFTSQGRPVPACFEMPFQVLPAK
jgi:hypothetical protein